MSRYRANVSLLIASVLSWNPVTAQEINNPSLRADIEQPTPELWPHLAIFDDLYSPRSAEELEITIIRECEGADRAFAAGRSAEADIALRRPGPGHIG